MSAVLEKIKFLVKLDPDLEKKISIQSAGFNSELFPYLFNKESRFKRRRYNILPLTNKNQ